MTPARDAPFSVSSPPPSVRGLRKPPAGRGRGRSALGAVTTALSFAGATCETGASASASAAHVTNSADGTHRRLQSGACQANNPIEIGLFHRIGARAASGVRAHYNDLGHYRLPRQVHVCSMRANFVQAVRSMPPTPRELRLRHRWRSMTPPRQSAQVGSSAIYRTPAMIDP